MIVILVDIADRSERRSLRGDSPRCFYEGLPVAGHIGVTLSSGTVIYLVQRHIVYKLTSLLLYFFKIGPIAQWELGYRESFGKQMWRRMGLRSPDNSTADAEDRFSNYLFSRWAGVHALCCIWMIGLVMYLVGTYAVAESVFSDWPWWATSSYGIGLFFLAAAYFGQSLLTAYAEKEAYLKRQ